MPKKHRPDVTSAWGAPGVQHGTPGVKGKLLIMLVSGDGLVSRDRNGKSDPFIKVEAGGKKRFQTEVHKKTLDPKFGNKDVCFLVTPDHLRMEDEVVLEVRDWDKIGRSEFMGEIRLPRLLETLDKPGMSDVVHDRVETLQPKEGGKKQKPVSGTLHFRLYFSRASELHGDHLKPECAFFYKALAAQFKTGDMILYDSYGLFPSLMKLTTNTPYGACGMVLKMPNKYTLEDELFVMEVTRNVNDHSDAFTDTHSGGLNIFRLFERLHHIHAQRVWYAPIATTFTEKQEDAMQGYIAKIHKSDDNEVLRRPFASPEAELIFHELCHSGQLDKDLLKYSDTCDLFAAAIINETAARAKHPGKDHQKAVSTDAHESITPDSLLTAKNSPWKVPEGAAPLLLRCYKADAQRYAKGLSAQGLGGSLPAFATPLPVAAAPGGAGYGDLPGAPSSNQYPEDDAQLRRRQTSMFVASKQGHAHHGKHEDTLGQAPPPPQYSEVLPAGHAPSDVSHAYGPGLAMGVAPSGLNPSEEDKAAADEFATIDFGQASPSPQVNIPGRHGSAGASASANLPVQAGGHAGALVIDPQGRLRKRTSAEEASFYTTFYKEFEKLQQFCPAFFGVEDAGPDGEVGSTGAGGAALLAEHNKWIVLENLTQGFADPCVLDLKMGSSVSPEMDAEKARRTAARDAATTTGTLGFRVTGMKATQPGGNVVEYRKMNDGSNQLPDEAAVVALLTDFFGGAAALRTDIVAAMTMQMTFVQNWMSVQTDLQFRSSSLLFVYDADPQSTAPVRVKMIDFAHVFRSAPGEGPDKAYNTGLHNAIRIFGSLAPPPPAYEGGGGDAPPPPF